MSANFPEYKILSVKDIIPYERNARVHSVGQVSQLVASIQEFGFTNPLLVDESGSLIAGHGRLAAAEKIGMQSVPAIALSGLSDAQKQALRLADNKLALNAAWDDDLLRTELGDLRDVGFDLGLTGFGEDELLSLFGAEPADARPDGAGRLADRFGIPPFSVLNAREGWWQDRKRAWLALGIQSEIGRGDQPNTSARVGSDEDATYRTIGGRKPNAIPGGGPMPLDRAGYAVPGGALLPAADYSKRQRGDGRGRAI